MKIKTTAAISVILMVIATVIGWHEKKTYTDFAAEGSMLSHVNVAVLSDQTAETIMEDGFSKTIRDSAKYILKVKADSDILFEFGHSSQYVVIEKIYQGEDVHVGDRILIGPRATSLFDFDGTLSLNMGFVNTMQEGEEYLVYLEDNFYLTDSRELFYYFPGTIVRPAFSYSTKPSRPISVHGEDGNSVNYMDVKDYEFFAQSEKGLAALESLKKELMKSMLQKDSVIQDKHSSQG